MNYTKYSTDRHLHLFIEGVPITPDKVEVFQKILNKHNIKAIYDMGSRDAIGFNLKRYFENSDITFNTCGYALYKEGGYGGFLGRSIKTRDDIKQHIEDLKRKGSDFVKVINSGILDREAKITTGGFNRDDLELIVTLSHEKGLPVYCHVSSEERIIDALIAGVDSIEHGFFMTEEALYMMKERNITWTPTIYALKCYIETVKGRSRELLEKILDDHIRMVSIATKMGININIGSDSGASMIRHGEAFKEEKKIINTITKI